MENYLIIGLASNYPSLYKSRFPISLNLSLFKYYNASFMPVGPLPKVHLLKKKKVKIIYCAIIMKILSLLVDYNLFFVKILLGKDFY